MNAQPRKTWILSDTVAEAVERLIEEGRVRDLDEVVQIGLGAVLDEDPELDKAIRAEVLPVIERMERDPSRAVPMEQAFADLRAHVARRRGEG